jgi:hypothetical protein
MVTYVLARFFDDDEQAALTYANTSLPGLGIWQLPGEDGAEVWMFSDQTEAELLEAGWKKGPRTD